jgi:hypothetical protein
VGGQVLGEKCRDGHAAVLVRLGGTDLETALDLREAALHVQGGLGGCLFYVLALEAPELAAA